MRSWVGSWIKTSKKSCYNFSWTKKYSDLFGESQSQNVFLEIFKKMLLEMCLVSLDDARFDFEDIQSDLKSVKLA